MALKVRDNTFHTLERHLTLPRPTTSTRTVYAAAAGLLADVDLGPRRVRSLGVTLSGLVSGAYQLTFDYGWKDRALDEAVDAVRARYGRHAVRPAATCAKGRKLALDSTHSWARAPKAGAPTALSFTPWRAAGRVEGVRAVRSQKDVQTLSTTHDGSTRRTRHTGAQSAATRLQPLRARQSTVARVCAVRPGLHANDPRRPA